MEGRVGVNSHDLENRSLKLKPRSSGKKLFNKDLIVKEKLTADEIYNCDETGLYWRALPTKTLAAENEAVAPGRKKMKDRKRFCTLANASGSHRIKLTLESVETLKAENITCIFMPPNRTVILQPMDQAVNESMKRCYRKQLLSKLLFEGEWR
ncbi:hypothetical protein AVEN_27097-1 [Araneus ventricosus]|uniref:DDE-1 domain-containing protein n=1 Tax=Araneus ventricosus TaxID=182803 RepID=A0A4Y2TPU4_ARAVE|nr:hypothetical protein AVEN_27097-1 [Araneus ventricosus]